MSMKDAVAGIGSHGNMLPREKGISLPLISIDGGHVIVTRLIFFTRVVAGDGTYITPPQYVATYDLTGGAFLSLREWSGEVPEPQNVEWKHERPSFERAEDVLTEFDEIWSLYDGLIPAFLQGAANTETRQRARMYLEYFDRHAEKPLAPYYEYFGGAFLRFVRQAAS